MPHTATVAVHNLYAVDSTTRSGRIVTRYTVYIHGNFKD